MIQLEKKLRAPRLTRAQFLEVAAVTTDQLKTAARNGNLPYLDEHGERVLQYSAPQIGSASYTLGDCLAIELTRSLPATRHAVDHKNGSIRTIRKMLPEAISKCDRFESEEINDQVFIARAEQSKSNSGLFRLRTFLGTQTEIWAAMAELDPVKHGWFVEVCFANVSAAFDAVRMRAENFGVW